MDEDTQQAIVEYAKITEKTIAAVSDQIAIAQKAAYSQDGLNLADFVVAQVEIKRLLDLAAYRTQIIQTWAGEDESWSGTEELLGLEEGDWRSPGHRL
jgi:hypothetical protein